MMAGGGSRRQHEQDKEENAKKNAWQVYALVAGFAACGYVLYRYWANYGKEGSSALRSPQQMATGQGSYSQQQREARQELAEAQAAKAVADGSKSARCCHAYSDVDLIL